MPRASRPSKPARRSSCPISCALDILGDRWSLLIVRDLFRGLSRYGEFAAGPEGIPTNILADRLVRLEDAGILTSTAYQQNPPRYAYALSAKGRALKPILAALAGWSLQHVPRTSADPALQALLQTAGAASPPA
ncbi:MAG TPA: helix-turn-helix domain-containing protein [Opitutaceae bacterium]|nr:helix-turn-helix domain-containing protein [Opitutaceae bacterium]